MSAPMMSMHPGPAASAATRAAAATMPECGVRSAARRADESMRTSGPLDGRRRGGVSRVHELTGDVGLHHAQLRIEDDEVGGAARREQAVADEAELPRRRRRADRRRVAER